MSDDQLVCEARCALTSPRLLPPLLLLLGDAAVRPLPPGRAGPALVPGPGGVGVAGRLAAWLGLALLL